MIFKTINNNQKIKTEIKINNKRVQIYYKLIILQQILNLQWKLMKNWKKKQN